MTDYPRGVSAIRTALQKATGKTEPDHHYGTVRSYAEGGPDPLDGVSVYRCVKPVSHWHFVTFGFSELDGKESPNAKVSGWGFELSFRLARSSEDQPPLWVVTFLQKLARFVFNTKEVFSQGDFIDMGGGEPIVPGSKLTALALALDPVLGRIATPNGDLEFLTPIGISAGELKAISEERNAAAFVKRISVDNPMLITGNAPA